MSDQLHNLEVEELELKQKIRRKNADKSTQLSTPESSSTAQPMTSEGRNYPDSDTGKQSALILTGRYLKGSYLFHRSLRQFNQISMFQRSVTRRTSRFCNHSWLWIWDQPIRTSLTLNWTSLYSTRYIYPLQAAIRMYPMRMRARTISNEHVLWQHPIMIVLYIFKIKL